MSHNHWEAGSFPVSLIFFPMGKTVKSGGWRWVPPLYLFQGLPSSIVMSTSVLLYKDMGVDVMSFSFWTSAVCLPWSLKPLWSPLVERFRTKRWWVLTMQALLVGLFAALGASMMAGDNVFYPLSLAIMLLVAFASASHDIACDGYYMMALPPREQSFFVGIRSTFYRVSLVMATGLIPFIAGSVGNLWSPSVGWGAAFGAAGVLMALFCLCCRFAMPVVQEPVGRQDDGLRIFFRALKSFFSHTGAVSAVTFFVTYRLGEALLSKLVTPFLTDDRAFGGLGLSVQGCSVVYGTLGVLMLVIGGVAGGVLASRFGIRRMLWPMLIFMNMPNLAYVALAHFQPEASSPYVYAAVMTEQLGYGFGFTAYMLVILKYVADAEYKAAEYAIATSLMSVSLLLPGMPAGWILYACGSYEMFFVIASVATIPGMVAAAFLKLPDER